ncbi:smg-4/UPF3 family domain-containing protein [Ditylenchus destructor]|uniref:Smg-4/UPF3 family domain-containing protein n=1 Tax=Ditylenchus destructor TaxID=166010 RepID=A0AAD4N6B7_9BILA|nr:smg-4/UPF3 family domain-containing protein [Ditylenchus destructor]
MPVSKTKDPKKACIKLVVRRLPVGLTPEELLEQLQPIPEYQHFWFCKADMDLVPFAFSRAYLAFTNESDAIEFAGRFNGYVFVDKQGNESAAIVEKAPFQGIVEERCNGKERDRRVNTINEDADYLKYVEAYNKSSTKRTTNFDELVAELEEKQKNLKMGFVKETPLTEFIVKQSTLKNIAKERKRISRTRREVKEIPENKPTERVKEQKVVVLARDKLKEERETVTAKDSARKVKPTPPFKEPISKEVPMSSKDSEKQAKHMRREKERAPKAFTIVNTKRKSEKNLTFEVKDHVSEIEKPDEKKAADSHYEGKCSSNVNAPRADKEGSHRRSSHELTPQSSTEHQNQSSDRETTKIIAETKAENPFGKKTGNSAHTSNESAEKSKARYEESKARRNKDRPERAIYRPGQNRVKRNENDSTKETLPKDS